MTSPKHAQESRKGPDNRNGKTAVNERVPFNVSAKHNRSVKVITGMNIGGTQRSLERGKKNRGGTRKGTSSPPGRDRDKNGHS